MTFESACKSFLQNNKCMNNITQKKTVPNNTQCMESHIILSLWLRVKFKITCDNWIRYVLYTSGDYWLYYDEYKFHLPKEFLGEVCFELTLWLLKRRLLIMMKYYPFFKIWEYTYFSVKLNNPNRNWPPVKF